LRRLADTIVARSTASAVKNSGREKETPIMNEAERNDSLTYKVVVNHEEQYSIWPADRENALGWKDVGKVGTKAECLEYIKEVWTDMRPLSLRNLPRNAHEG
jgi:MbtH protein